MSYRRRGILSIGAATVAALAGCSAFDDDSNDTDEETELDSVTVPGNEWHSFQRTPQNTGVADGTAVPDEPAERWRQSLSGGLTKQPVVGSEHLYAVTDDGTLHALATDTGRTAWTESLGETRTECPCLVDGLVVAGAEGGELVAFDGESGETEWTVDLPGLAGDPTPFDGTVYVGTDDGSVVGIDADSQEEVLRVDAGETVRTAPAVTDEQLYVGVGGDGGAGAFLALERTTGEQRWQEESFRPDAVVAAGRRVVTVGNGLGFYTPDGGRRGQSSAVAVPAVTREAIYFGGEVVSALNLTQDGPSWSHWLVEAEESQTIASAPASVADGALCIPYTPSAGEGERGVLLALDAESGDPLWERELPSGAPTAAVLADDAVFVGTADGDLVGFE